MTTLLLSHPATLAHDMGMGHPERPDRIRAIETALAGSRFATLHRASAPMGTQESILRVHPASYYETLAEAAPQSGMVELDADTRMNSGTWEAALRSVGAATAAVDAVMRGSVDNAFVATRPPGHHAETARPMGFCLFNTIAIAARHAKAVHGVERIAIVDFDVHHGNGTQEIFFADKSVLFCSSHEMPLYPGSGAREERGEFGQIVNAPMRAGDAGDVFRDIFEGVMLPRIKNFSPDLVLISAGFDAHHRDPLANINLVEDDFSWVTARLMEVASTSAKGRIVSVLEGGYDLQALSTSVAAHVSVLMGMA